MLWVWRSDRERGKDALNQALLSVLTIFLGIFLALSVNSHHENRQTIKNLIQVISTAKAEAERNLVIVQESSLHNDNERLVRESPITALNVLLNMPTFLEQGSTEIVSELLTLNTQLNWKITYRPASLGAVYESTKIVSANQPKVIENVTRVIELLEKQLRLLN